MKGFILTYIVAIAGSIAALRYPLIGLQVYVGLAILRPQAIFGFAGDLGGMSLLVGVAVLIGWLFRGFGSWKLSRATPIVGCLIAFTLWFVVSATMALETAPAFVSVNELMKFVLPVVIGVTLIESEKDWRPILWTIVLAQGYVGFENNLNYVVKGYNTAAEGFGGMDNNCFGASLVTVLGPALALMISSRTIASRLLAAAASALILHTILLTYSRGTLVGLVALGVVAFVVMPKNPKYIGALLITALVAARFVGPQLAERYSTIVASEEERDSSAESRLDLWRDCLKVVSEYPVFGVGPANWRVVAKNYGWPEGKSAHSVWMETAAEVGVPGAALLLFFFVITAYRLWPIARESLTAANQYEVAMASGVILGVVGFCVCGQFVSVPGLETPYYISMLGAGLLKIRGRQAALSAASAVTVQPIPSLS